MGPDFESEKRTAMEAVALAWNQRELVYSVAHGVEQYPKIGRDLDVVFTPETLVLARDTAIETLEQLGWRVAFASREWAWWIFAFKKCDQQTLAIEIDLLPWLQAGFTQVVYDPSSATHRFQAGPFWTDPWASVAKRIVLQAFSDNFKRFDRRPWELALDANELNIFKSKLASLGGSAAFPFIQAVAEADISRMRETTPGLKRGMMSTAIKNPRNLALKARFTIERFLRLNVFPRRVIPIVALVGPDGVGKTTVIQELKRLIEEELVFPKVITRHWRPTLLPDLSDLAKLRFRAHTNMPQAKPPRRQAGRASLVRAAYYGIDFLLGHPYRDCRESVRLNIIIYDRHAVDMVVNPERYGIRSMPRWLFRLLPKPDYTVALVDTPERIIARKAELNSIEIDSQVQQWKKLLQEGAIDEVIEVNSSAKVVARHIFDAIVEQFCRHNLPPLEPV